MAAKSVLKGKLKELFLVETGEFHDVLVDSGSYDHVCPEWFAPSVPVRPINGSFNVSSAEPGRTLAVYGVKTCNFQVEDEKGNPLRMEIEMTVMNVRRPILSVTKMKRKGIST
eukprot:10182407-Alexandrium_andersonii.AAC.1